MVGISEPPHPGSGGGYHSAHGSLVQPQTGRPKNIHEQAEYFGVAASPIIAASVEYDANGADFADEAMAQRVMIEEEMRRRDGGQGEHDQQELVHNGEQQNQPVDEEDQYMRNYVNNAMRIGQKLGLDKIDLANNHNQMQMQPQSNKQKKDYDSQHFRNHTLTLSGTLSGITTSYGFGTGQGLNHPESTSSNYMPQELAAHQ